MAYRIEATLQGEAAVRGVVVRKAGTESGLQRVRFIRCAVQDWKQATDPG